MEVKDTESTVRKGNYTHKSDPSCLVFLFMMEIKVIFLHALFKNTFLTNLMLREVQLIPASTKATTLGQNTNERAADR